MSASEDATAAPRSLASVLDRAADALTWWAATGGPATSSILGTGAVAELESEAAARLGQRLGLALPSATMALRVALEAVDVGPGDEVVVPALGWGAASAAARSLGAHVVDADVVAPTGHLDPTDVLRRCTPRTKAVVVTHLFGQPADAAEVRRLLPAAVALVEDCSQALGATSGGRPVGSIGDISVCSFGPGKVVDAGEGGVAATSDRTLLERMARSSQHLAGQRVRGCDDVTMGNLAVRIHPVAAVMACHGLSQLDEALDGHRWQRARLLAELRQVPGIRIVDRPVDEAGGSTVAVLTVGPLGPVERTGHCVDLRPLVEAACGHHGPLIGHRRADLERSFVASLVD